MGITIRGTVPIITDTMIRGTVPITVVAGVAIPIIPIMDQIITIRRGQG